MYPENASGSMIWYYNSHSNFRMSSERENCLLRHCMTPFSQNNITVVTVKVAETTFLTSDRQSSQEYAYLVKDERHPRIKMRKIFCI